MKPVRFVLAFPLHERPVQFEQTSRVSEICGEQLLLWTDAGVPLIDLGNAGLMLGAVFERRSASLLKSLPADAASCGSSDMLAAWLVRECWGAYFAILFDPRSNQLSVLVDPSGLLPVYCVQTTTHIFMSSHPSLLQQASGVPLRPCWDMLRSHLLRPDLRQRPTCLSKVIELTPGEYLPLGNAGMASRRIWRPEPFMPSGADITFGEAAEELRYLSIAAIGAWAKLLGPVAVAASGGVDSSLICAAVVCADQPLTCVTLATADPSGDERRFVRLLGEHLGAASISSIYDPKWVDPLCSVSAELARPSRKSFMAALDAALLEATESVGANAIFDGNGGDNLFCFLHSAAPVVDRLRCHGPGRGALSTFLDMCRVTGCDIPTMSQAVLRRLFRSPGFVPWSPDTRLLLLADDVNALLNPLTDWFDAAVGCHNGKLDHLSLILRNQNHLNGLGAASLPRFSPLMSQPLVEFCLSVPTWIWCKGGVNRSVARAAFENDLPRAILTRTSKAGPDSFIRHTFADHRSVIRDLLMDGLLAQHGLLDRVAVDAALEIDALSGDGLVYRLLDLAEAESWARSWSA